MRLVCDNLFYLCYGCSQISMLTLVYTLYPSYLTVSCSCECIKIIFIKKISISACHFEESETSEKERERVWERKVLKFHSGHPQNSKLISKFSVSPHYLLASWNNGSIEKCLADNWRVIKTEKAKSCTSWSSPR